MKVTLCGGNKIHMPESGCGDCEHLEYLINKLREDFDEFVAGALTEDEIVALTPIECPQPEEDETTAVVCEAEVCLAVVCNNGGGGSSGETAMDTAPQIRQIIPKLAFAYEREV